MDGILIVLCFPSILRNSNLPSRTDLGALKGEDPWYLVMEDDVMLCPTWRERMIKELPEAPTDADIIKLYFFGHWRKAWKSLWKLSFSNESLTISIHSTIGFVNAI